MRINFEHSLYTIQAIWVNSLKETSRTCTIYLQKARLNVHILCEMNHKGGFFFAFVKQAEFSPNTRQNIDACKIWETDKV